MTKKEKEMEKYIKQLCKDADVFYDPEFGTHLEDERVNDLFRQDIQKELDMMVENGTVQQVGDKYFA